MTLMRQKIGRLTGARRGLPHALTRFEPQFVKIWKTKINIRKRPLDRVVISACKSIEHDTKETPYDLATVPHHSRRGSGHRGHLWPVAVQFPEPPITALLGLLGMLAGEAAVQWIRGHSDVVTNALHMTSFAVSTDTAAEPPETPKT